MRLHRERRSPKSFNYRKTSHIIPLVVTLSHLQQKSPVGIAMFYKPKYCCSCGEKIERTEWNLLTSRRFCESCALENKRHDYALRVLAGSGVLGLVFGVGSLWGSAGADRDVTAAPVAPRTVELPPQNKSVTAAPTAEAPTENPAVGNHLVRSQEPERLSGSTENPKLNAKFFCGALTKKGTPCSRKVRSAGSRCYQHEGKPAAPPQN